MNTSESCQHRLKEIQALFSESGQEMYAGEPVTQTEHALQAADLAERSGASEELVTAALLHDVGHLLHDLGEDIAQHGVDDCHESMGAEWLASVFSPAVTRPVQLHVAAKRYRCATDGDYFARLSDASRLSLSLQGGPFSASEVEQFSQDPFFAEALRLRGWDEAAKVPGKKTPDLAHFLEIVERVLENTASS